jgi:hypothetical protein
MPPAPSGSTPPVTTGFRRRGTVPVERFLRFPVSDHSVRINPVRIKAVKTRPPAANNVSRDASVPDSARSADEAAEGDAAAGDERGPGLWHHVRRHLSRDGAQRVAGHAARLSRHGWRRVSTAVATANSGGRISRPVGAVWQRVARRPPGSNGPTGENPHAHRNRRLAFDFAVLAAAAALLLMLHHTFRPHGRPRLATAFAATSDPSVDAASAQAPADAPPHQHRRRTHRPATPPVVADARAIDTHAGDPVALGDPHHDADTHKAIDGGADFGDHPDAGHRTDHPIVPPVEVSGKSPAHDTIVHETVIHETVVHDAPRQDMARHDLPAHDGPPHDSKAAADAALDNLLSTPVASGPSHGNDAAAPIGQSEPPVSHDLDKRAHPHHADDPVLVDSREPGDPAGHHHDHPKKTVDVGAPLPDDFAAPMPAKAPDEHHHDLKEHEHAGPKDPPRDEFAMPAPGPAPASAAPLDVPPPKEKDDVHHHSHHPADHGPADSPFGGEPSPTPGKDADGLPPKLDAPSPDASHGLKPGPEHADRPHHDDPLLDVGPKLDGPPKDAPPKDGPAGLSPKSAGDKIEVSKHDHPDDGLPVLSVPSPHKPEAKLNDEPSKSDGPKMDDLGPPTRTANAADAVPGGGLGDNGAKNLPPKPPESQAPAGNDSSLNDLLNSKVPAPGSPSAAPATKPAPPAAAPKEDPFHTDSALPADSAPHAVAPPKQAEPAPAESVAPTAKPAAEPAHPVESEDALPSVAVAHHQIEKDETGASVHYKIVGRNNGKKSVKSFEVDEAVPVDYTVQVTDPPAETRAQDLHWTLHDVAPGEERTILITLAPPARPVETPLAAQPVPIAAATRAPAASDAPQLKLELITPVEVHVGETCRIGFRATNLGGQTTDLKVNLDLPQQLRYTRGQQLQYKIIALGDHEAREDYLTATATGTGQVELRAELLHAGHSIATAKGTCHVAPAGAAKGGIQQTGAWVPSGPTRTANGSDCLCLP